MQSLSNLMSSPLAMVMLGLWGMLFFLAVRQCLKWRKARRNEKIIYKNHPAIPVKEYKLSEFERLSASVANLKNSNPKPINKLNVWDV